MLNFLEAKSFIDNLAKKGSDFSLDGIKAILQKLFNPQDKLKIIHIAGTNGKGSTSTYLSNILLKSGYTVGTFLTPAVFSYNEIFKLNNISISNEDFLEVFNEIYPVYFELKDKFNITSFMYEVAICYTYFYKKKVDFLIVECGLGGLYDATNVEKNNILSVITQIALDHQQVLGDLSSIAQNKCGIIKNSAVVTTKNNLPVMDIIKKNAENKNAKLIISDVGTSKLNNLQYITYKNKVYTTKMLGEYQKINLPLAIDSANYIKSLGYNITEDAIFSGIKESFLPGRFEVISTNPLFIIDGCHNPNASLYLKKYLKNKQNVTIILGIFKDKNYKDIVKNTAIYATKIYTFNWDNPRALSGIELSKEVKKYNNNVEFTTLQNAIKKAKLNKNGIVIAFGSLSFLNIVKSEVKNG